MRALIGSYFMKKKWMVHRDDSGWRHAISSEQKKRLFSMKMSRYVIKVVDNV